MIQFSISIQFSSIWPVDRALSGATTSGQSGPGSDGNEGVLCIPQSSSITGTSSLDCLVSYSGHSLGGSYSSAEMQSVYSTAPDDWAIDSMTPVLKFCRVWSTSSLPLIQGPLWHRVVVPVTNGSRKCLKLFF